MAGDELENVFDQIVIIQKAIATPTGEIKGIGNNAFDDWPGTINAFPCFINIWERTGVVREASRRQQTLTIAMHLVFAPSDQKYSDRARRRWHRAVLNAFDVELRLNNACHYAHIDEVIGDSPLEIGGTQYITATFMLTVLYDEALAFAS